MVLYRKYRPKKFAEVVGQEHVVETLQGAIKTGRLAHAYLFTGPRGTGKTSLARLLAKAVNCEKGQLRSEGDEILSPAGRSDACAVCSSCKEVEEGRAMDLVEIDAASNRGIDEIRALREGTRFSSMNAGKYKVYVIDECHQLTKEASNALLKTLEEPPAKILFILATTEPHKVLPTIVSRVQKFDFKKLTTDQIVFKLQRVASEEKIKIVKDHLRLIARQAEGSLRDAESNLAKLIAFRGQEIDEEAIKEVLGIIPFNFYHDFFHLVHNQKRTEALNLVSQIYESGLDLENFTKGLLDYARRILVARANPSDLNAFSVELGEDSAQKISGLAKEIDGKGILKLISALMRAQQDLKISPIPQLPLEIAITELID
ncbi:MAG: DNA polymerase III, subunit gamma and tau [Candidatus Yanofskybacteria bacterium RIFCSPHIGHO2_02_FULL_43_15c]|uniref:DNA polymerase III subunit gamma/tau n=2 Tax=Candidatus Yanofskyibacteriota TaxID=1752733 RepID=A0A1F8H5A7_9BACT|nr:MAG: DNA polymerase III, subunit gamma and tau [Candidatus Yanofskybacteria bacterium RIFCSPHIGHO2_02_FULL_43_15c]OGN32777.1 MAG: DNA polymerase III, subunit gamma and tau [Candidatus Yanofskybacteria bacterium RIFCSPLOWO2_02_FULL_43_10b]